MMSKWVAFVSDAAEVASSPQLHGKCIKDVGTLPKTFRLSTALVVFNTFFSLLRLLDFLGRME